MAQTRAVSDRPLGGMQPPTALLSTPQPTELARADGRPQPSFREELRRIPPRFLSWVELSDGPYEYAEDRLDEVINRRRLPGEGEFPIPAYVAVCRELGYDGPWGVEVLSEELRNLPIEQIFDRAYETTSAQLDLARESRRLDGGDQRAEVPASPAP